MLFVRPGNVVLLAALGLNLLYALAVRVLGRRDASPEARRMLRPIEIVSWTVTVMVVLGTLGLVGPVQRPGPDPGYAGVLLLAIPLFKQQQIWGALLAAMACGLQNAMVTTYSGAAVRTTHLSGMFTDLGIGLGHLLRGMPLPMRRLTLSGLIISGFLGGGVLGAWFYRHWGYDALLAPALLTGSTGIGYVLYRQWVQAGQTPP